MSVCLLGSRKTDSMGVIVAVWRRYSHCKGFSGVWFISGDWRTLIGLQSLPLLMIAGCVCGHLLNRGNQQYCNNNIANADFGALLWLLKWTQNYGWFPLLCQPAVLYASSCDSPECHCVWIWRSVDRQCQNRFSNQPYRCSGHKFGSDVVVGATVPYGVFSWL